MGYSGTWCRINTVNRNLQKSVGGKFSKSDFDISGTNVETPYNKEFDKVYSDAELQEIREKVRSELRRERIKSILLTLYVVIGLCYFFWPTIKEHINYFF